MVKILRERWLISHKSYYEREVEVEITILNDTHIAQENIFIICQKFMPVLKILNSKNKELILYNNEQTREFLGSKSTNSAKELLDSINTKKVYVLWIKLADEPLKVGHSEIIKLRYRDNEEIKNIMSKSRIYTIPKFINSWNLAKGIKNMHEIFYIVVAPPDSDIEEGMKKIVIVENGKTRALTDKDGVHTNNYGHTLSIRIPPQENEINFKINYYLNPNRHETNFFIVAVISLIALSLFASLISTNLINYSSPALDVIKNHINHLFAFIFPISFAAIGLVRNPIFYMTRWLLLIPIVISIVGFMFQQPQSP